MKIDKIKKNILKFDLERIKFLCDKIGITYDKHDNKSGLISKILTPFKKTNQIQNDFSKVLLFSSEAMNGLVNDIMKDNVYKKYIKRGIITKSSKNKLNEYGPANCHNNIKNKYADFDDGWPDLYICNHEEIKNHHVVYLASITNTTDLFEQIAVIRSIVKYRAKSLKVILPYLPVGTMERISNPGEIVTADTFIQILSNSIPITSSGPVTFSIIDIHALQEQFYFSDNVLVELKSAIPLLKNKLIPYVKKGKTIIIVFPDDGAYKRYKNKFNEYATIVCGKVRVGDERIVRIMEINKKDGKDIDINDKNNIFVIVDDLTQSGGTLKNCAVALREDSKIGGPNGISDIYTFVTHPVFPKLDKVVDKFKDNVVTKFFITDTIPTKSMAIQRLKNNKFEILSIINIVMYLICDNLDFIHVIKNKIIKETYPNFINDMES
jgi:phosphoribosylpyrophosphate synthetase